MINQKQKTKKQKQPNKMKGTKELLAPAGDFACLRAAINSGADAVYFGVKDFNMRARAKNFQLSDLPKIKKMCQPKGIRRYLTLNTLIFDKELKKTEKIIKSAKKYVDAIICSDIAVIMLCKKYKVPFHISTQCSVSNIETAKFYKKLGAERIVLARELNLSQIKEIAKIIPVEIFIHGAMCVSVSGRCFISGHLFKGQSANEGKCIQPCRRAYHVRDNQGNKLRVENNHIFSAKDLCSLPFFEKLKKIPNLSYKIEGRNKTPDYVDTVVRVYKNAINNVLTEKQIKESIAELKKVYNKGFSSGFLFDIPTSDDFSDAQNSKATHEKIFVGIIKNYFKNPGVGVVKIQSEPLKIGNEVMIIGKTTGVVRAIIDSIQIHNQNIKIAKKGQLVGIKLPLCKKNDDIYLIVQKKK